jgi:hypothetical protein
MRKSRSSGEAIRVDCGWFDAWKDNIPGAPDGGPFHAGMSGGLAAMNHVYVEVIDANASVVLASAGPMRPSHARSVFPQGFFPGTRLALRFGESPEGHVLAKIGTVRLEAAR